MEFNRDHLQEDRKYTAPKELIGLEYLYSTPMVIERYIENALRRNSHDHKHDGVAPHIRQSVL
jgi:hypothetical protein